MYYTNKNIVIQIFTLKFKYLQTKTITIGLIDRGMELSDPEFRKK